MLNIKICKVIIYYIIIQEDFAIQYNKLRVLVYILVAQVESFT